MNSTFPSTRARRECSPSSRQKMQGIAVCVAAALLGALCLNDEASRWYQSVQKPLWAPPLALWVPLWMALAIPLGLAWAHLQAAPQSAPARTWARRWFAIQLFLGALWIATFFAWRSPSWAYVLVLVWWLAVLALLWTGSRAARPTFLLVLPTFLWVTFASALSFAVLGFNIIAPRVEKMDADPKNQRPGNLLRKPAPEKAPQLF